MQTKYDETVRKNSLKAEESAKIVSATKLVETLPGAVIFCENGQGRGVDLSHDFQF